MATPTATERMLTPATAGHRNGLPEPGEYVYRGTGRSLNDTEAAERLRIRDRGDIDAPFSAPREWHREMDGEREPGPPPVIPAVVLREQPAQAALPQRKPRCRRCGYLRTRCTCGGGR